MYDDYDASDEKWYVRLLAALARRKSKMKARDWLIACGATFGLFLLYALVCILLGYGNVVDEATLSASSFYGELPSHTAAYVWVGGQRDAQISRHVFDARRNFSLDVSRHIALVASSFDDSRGVAHAVECSDTLSANSSLRTELLEAMAHSEALLKEPGAPPCTCAPVFGYDLQQLAFAAPTAGADGDAFVHAFGIHDKLSSAYDALDSAALGVAEIKLAVTNESQNERYNQARGSFAVIRRARLRLSFADRHCHSQTLWLANELAVCAQRCLDLMRGVDVRERARMQWRLGIRLNEQQFGPPPTAVKDEL